MTPKKETAVDRENESQRTLFEKNRAKLIKNYRGKVIAYRKNQLYTATNYRELWEMIGVGPGFVADLRQIDPETNEVVYPPIL